MTALRTTVAAALLTTLLAGCSGDPYEDYCGVVSEKQEELSRVLGEGGPDVLLRALPIFRDLEDAAPDDIRDDWRIVVSGLTALEDALDDAGVDPATYDRDDPPEGLSQADKDAIDVAAGQLTSEATVTAFSGVDQQAKDVCRTPLQIG